MTPRSDRVERPQATTADFGAVAGEEGGESQPGPAPVTVGHRGTRGLGHPRAEAYVGDPLRSARADAPS